nr:Down syndrome cell adhesion molecule-like protein Dscam2 [Parasteatoda tepidariorum]
MTCGFFITFLFFELAANGLSTDPLSKGPSFLSEPPNRVEFSNSSGTVIPCLTDGRPRPIVTWVKNDGEVVHDLTGLRYIQHDGSLVFRPFAAEDYRPDVHASIYRCEVSNNIGIIGSRDVHVRAGKKLKLTLQFIEIACREKYKYAKKIYMLPLRTKFFLNA